MTRLRTMMLSHCFRIRKNLNKADLPSATIKLLLAIALLVLSTAFCGAAVRNTKPASVHSLKLSPGDTVRIIDGVYEMVTVRLCGRGTLADPIVMMPQTPGGVVFSEGSRVYLDGSYLVVEGFRFEKQQEGYNFFSMTDTTSHCRISECIFDGSACEFAPKGKWGNFVQLRGSYQEVSHCAFLDKKTIGAMLAVNIQDGQAVHHVIRNNFFTRPNTLMSSKGVQINGQESIRVGSSTFSMKDAGCTVADNWFLHCDGEVEIISSKSCFNVYERNLFEESRGTLTLRHGNDCIVRGNWFIGKHKNGSGGVRIIGERHRVEDNYMLELRGYGAHSPVSVIRGFQNPKLSDYYQVKDVVIKGNWLVDCDFGMQIAIVGHPENVLMPEGLRIEGNTIICHRKNQIAVEVYGMPALDIKWTNNVIWGGTINGVELKRARKEPSVPDFSAQMQKVRDNAGPSYWKPQFDN